MQSRDYIGWASSLLLLITLAKQIHQQWKERTSRGVSKWLYLGQLSAEIGFIVYSFLVRNWVFLATNSVLLLESVLGVAITLHFQRRNDEPSELSRSGS